MPRRPHSPSVNQRTQVEAWALVGVPHHQIAVLNGISIKTLLKYYDTELKLGKAKANAEAGKRLFGLVQRDNLGAIIFWLKAQAEWREVHLHEIDDRREAAKARDTPDESSDADAARTYKEMLDLETVK